MVMASAGVNVPAGAGGDGVGNPTAGSGATPECQMRRRRRLAPQGSGEAGGPSWVRRLRPAASSRSRFSPPSSSSASQGSADCPVDVDQDEEEEDDPEVQEMELAPLPPPVRRQLRLRPHMDHSEPPPVPVDLFVAAPVWPEPAMESQPPPVPVDLFVAAPVWPEPAMGSEPPPVPVDLFVAAPVRPEPAMESQPPPVPVDLFVAAPVQPEPAVAQPETPPVPVDVAVFAPAWPVAFGSVTMQGRLRMMEDTISVHPALCNWTDGSPMHFFAVFDGHGGPHVSALCRDRMHEFVREEMAREGGAFLRRRQQRLAPSSDDGAESSVAAFLRGAGPEPWSEQEEEERAWRAALSRSFRRADAMAPLACGCGRVTRPACRCPLSDNAANPLSRGIVGSTAVVALLVRGRLIVANCGDSRAVLGRGPAGMPPVHIPLSFDHKPERPDEMARIMAAGGRVLFNNGLRVRGILAMSRAIGDRLLRPEVICEPEITFTDRTVEDQCLILASDGMWDVIDNATACHVAHQCLEDGIPPPTDPAAAAAAAAGGAPAADAVVGPDEEPRCVSAASLLGRLAIGRNSEDNISVIVIDLKHRE